MVPLRTQDAMVKKLAKAISAELKKAPQKPRAGKKAK